MNKYTHHTSMGVIRNQNWSLELHHFKMSHCRGDMTYKYISTSHVIALEHKYRYYSFPFLSAVTVLKDLKASWGEGSNHIFV